MTQLIDIKLFYQQNTAFSIAPDKRGFSALYFSYFSMKTYVVGTHEKCLSEALLMSTHNVYLHGEIRKIAVLFGCKNCSI